MLFVYYLRYNYELVCQLTDFTDRSIHVYTRIYMCVININIIYRDICLYDLKISII